ncbi:MAG: hypothetical protein AMJ79_11820 [Phycisphaerae bacterium SM23_30]|nr:MAG: hypothetical protein AMJ79_11820 [Phycisphaerae bacterium SM23_30]
MTTLIAVYNSDGLVGRCDEKCHNAKEPDCDCICGGANHGVGFKQAQKNTKKMTEKELRKNLPAGQESARVKINDFKTLFDMA